MTPLHDDTIGAVSSSAVSPSGGPSGAGVSTSGTSGVQASGAGETIAAEAQFLTRGARFKAATYRVLSRCAYWSPVLVALVLFAQVSFRGLRPSMAEARRLASAETTLGDRHARAAAENREVAAHLAARQDPIFRERQRRLRLIETPASSSAPTQGAHADDGS